MIPDKARIALDLLLCRTNLEVCQRNQISETTLYRLKKEPEFQEIVSAQKRALFQDAMQKAQAYGAEAIEVLRDVATDATAPPSARVSAASKILELGSTMFDQEEITERITALERSLHAESKNRYEAS